MADAERWLESYCKKNKIDISKIEDDEWDEIVDCLQANIDAYLDSSENELMKEFAFGLKHWDKFKDNNND